MQWPLVLVMDSWPLLKDAARILVLIDSKAFDDLLTKQNRLAMAILRHRDSKELTFVRSPFETRHEELKTVTEYTLLEKSGTPLIQIGQTESVFYALEEIREIARKTYGRLQVTEDELDRIRTVHVQDVLNRSNEPNIYITDDRVLLSRHTGVMSLEGASMFLDLLFKSKGKYYASSGYTLDKRYWYLLSMRLKLPHYNEGDRWIDALAFRFCHCLMALDEIGIAFFSGSGVDTILYHFSRVISESQEMQALYGTKPLSVSDFFRIISDNVSIVHLSDAKGSTAGLKETEHLPLGSGEVDFKALLRAMRDSNFTGPIVLETQEEDVNNALNAVRARKYVDKLKF